MSNTHQEIDLKAQLQKSLIAIKKLKDKLNESERSKNEPIAVVGMDCRFPGGANNPEAFWKLLYNNEVGISEIPSNRWNLEDYYNPSQDVEGKIYTKCAGFIDNVENFDAGFFNISPREVMSMDPQQRLLLEVCWHALENANINPENLYETSTGVFIGISSFDYAARLRKAGKEVSRYVGTGNTLSVAAGRISYVLGLTGPSVAVDTSCSSSLVTLHMACQSLRNKECNVALTGGISLILSPEVTINFCEAKMLSPDGLCKTFDESANGYVRGEGCGIIVLKRLSDAIANGDNILACIKGSAVNHDGPSGGLTVPNGSSQKNVIKKAMENAGILPHEIDYFEAHGTGTPLGDPIEMDAIGTILKGIEKRALVGSVKTNIGHLEPAAGISGVMKIILSLQNQLIPAHLNFKNPNKYIPWKDLPIDIVTQNTPWKISERKRIAGVSSFGFSGTNAHVVVEEGILSTVFPHENVDTPCLLTLSAKSEKALEDLINLYVSYLNNNPALSFQDICYTANTCRSHFKYRKAIVASSANEAVKMLTEILNGESPSLKGDLSRFQREGWGEGLKFLNGEEINWNELYKYKKYNKVNLPNYPFQREKYWVENEGLTLSEKKSNQDYENRNELNKSEVVKPISESILLNKLESALLDDRYEILLEAVRTEVAKVLQLPSHQLPDVTVGFIELGLDSLMGIELKNKLQLELGYTLNTTVLFNYSTIELLVNYLLKEIFNESETPNMSDRQPIENPGYQDVILTNLNEITDEEAELLLQKKLAMLEHYN